MFEEKVFKTLHSRLKKKQEEEKDKLLCVVIDRKSKTSPEMSPGSKVRMQVNKREWVSGKITKAANSPRSFFVQSDDGRTFRRNSIHIHPTTATIPYHKEIVTTPSPSQATSSSETPSPSQATSSSETTTNVANYHTQEQSTSAITKPLPNVVVTKYGRVVKPVDRYKPT